MMLDGDWLLDPASVTLAFIYVLSKNVTLFYRNIKCVPSCILYYITFVYNVLYNMCKHELLTLLLKNLYDF